MSSVCLSQFSFHILIIFPLITLITSFCVKETTNPKRNQSYSIPEYLFKVTFCCTKRSFFENIHLGYIAVSSASCLVRPNECVCPCHSKVA